jgi:predicted Rossmann fold nucleotide-binding protein DprA/Smf involved in DNA uptake
MNDLASKRFWIALTLIPNLSPRKFHILLENFSSPQEIWEAPLRKTERDPRLCRVRRDVLRPPRKRQRRESPGADRAASAESRDARR